MKNILILNQAHTSNLGDIAIGESISGWVKGNGWNPVTLPFWDEHGVFGKIGYTKLSALLKTVPATADIIVGKWIRNAVDGLLKKDRIDCAICGGGELFCSHRGFNAAFYCWVKELRSRGIPCCVMGVSGDDSLSRLQIVRNRKALAQCFLVSVRDDYSKRIFKDLYGIEAELAPDLVFLMDDCNDAADERKNVVCVPVHLSKNMEGRIESETDADFYHRIIEECKTPGDLVILTTTEERDQAFTKSICDEINRQFDTGYEFRPYDSLNVFCDLLKHGRIVISGRMHAMILGLLYGCKPKPIAFKTKLRVFEEEYGMYRDAKGIVIRTKSEYGRYVPAITDAMNST